MTSTAQSRSWACSCHRKVTHYGFHLEFVSGQVWPVEDTAEKPKDSRGDGGTLGWLSQMPFRQLLQNGCASLGLCVPGPDSVRGSQSLLPLSPRVGVASCIASLWGAWIAHEHLSHAHMKFPA